MADDTGEMLDDVNATSEVSSQLSDESKAPKSRSSRTTRTTKTKTTKAKTTRTRKASTTKKQEATAHEDADALNRLTQEATQASSDPMAAPRQTLTDVEPSSTELVSQAVVNSSVQLASTGSTSQQADATPSSPTTAMGTATVRRTSRHRTSQTSKTSGAAQSQAQNSQNAQNSQAAAQSSAQQRAHQRNNNRRRNRRNNSVDLNREPSLTLDELQNMKVAELRAKAEELELDATGMKKAELVQAIYEKAAYVEGFRTVAGILDIHSDGYGFLRSENYMQGDNDAFVYQQIIRQYELRRGDYVEGVVAPNVSNLKFPPLQRVQLINGKTPEEIKSRARFKDLTPIYPNERLVMENGKDSITGRAIDLVAPIGKGQRGLIVSPPKAGKTTILKHICKSIAANNPEVHLICLLVDERPEEVTDMQRSIHGEVVASTFDMPAENHTTVAELVIERAKRLVEQGEDVVVVLDSITRLARAYNLAAPASGRILSGGVDSAALYPPKRFLGAARNIEHGGSLTIIASALIDTGSKMDEVIFEEFKGTGNMELKLDRELADKRIFPAIDPVASGTRNEDLLIDPSLQPFVWGIRRILANMNNIERAQTSLVKSLKATSSNYEFLIRSAKKAQQEEFADAL